MSTALVHPMQSSPRQFGHCVRAPDSSGLWQKDRTTPWTPAPGCLRLRKPFVRRVNACRQDISRKT